MFSNLSITRDKKTNTFIGGGYTLNSSFLNAGIPPFSQTGGSGDSQKKTRPRPGSRSRSRSSSPSLDGDAVSSVLERANGLDAIIIPAGLFMIHATQPSSTCTSACTEEGVDYGVDNSMAKNIKKMLYNGPEFTSGEEHEDGVIPSDLYERLFSMLSPSASDAKLYWHPKAATRSGKHKRNGKPDSAFTRRTKLQKPK